MRKRVAASHTGEQDRTIALRSLSKTQTGGLVISLLYQDTFNQMSISYLEEITGIDQTQWCKWFRGQGVSERRLEVAADKLCVSAGELLDLIRGRRAATRPYSENGRNYRVARKGAIAPFKQRLEQLGQKSS